MTGCDELGRPEGPGWITLHECEDAAERCEQQGRAHGEVKDPFAPEGVGPNNAENEEGYGDFASCEAKDGPRLDNPIILDRQRLLCGFEIEEVFETPDARVVSDETRENQEYELELDVRPLLSRGKGTY